MESSVTALQDYGGKSSTNDVVNLKILTGRAESDVVYIPMIPNVTIGWWCTRVYPLYNSIVPSRISSFVQRWQWSIKLRASSTPQAHVVELKWFTNINIIVLLYYTSFICGINRGRGGENTYYRSWSISQKYANTRGNFAISFPPASTVWRTVNNCDPEPYTDDYIFLLLTIELYCTHSKCACSFYIVFFSFIRFRDDLTVNCDICFVLYTLPADWSRIIKSNNI